jgi:hypothetical protein
MIVRHLPVPRLRLLSGNRTLIISTEPTILQKLIPRKPRRIELELVRGIAILMIDDNDGVLLEARDGTVGHRCQL